MQERDRVTGIPINPINPVTINELTITELSNLLEQQREKRLAYVKKLEELTKVKVEAHRADIQLKFEKQVERVKAMLAKMEEGEEKIREGINRLKLLAIEFGE